MLQSLKGDNSLFWIELPSAKDWRTSQGQDNFDMGLFLCRAYCICKLRSLTDYRTLKWGQRAEWEAKPKMGRATLIPSTQWHRL